MLLRVAAAVVIIASGAVAWWYFFGQWRTTTDDAYVVGDIVSVMPLTAGTVISVNADATQAVNEGQALVQLDDADARQQLETAEAGLGTAVREVRGLYATSEGNLPLLLRRRADLARAEAERASAEAELVRDEAEYKRRAALAEQHFVSPENVQIAKTARDSARARRDAAASMVKAAEAAIAQTEDEAKVSTARVDNTSLDSHPGVRAAAARVREASLALARTRVLAPVCGEVAKRSVQVGERVAAGAPLMAIVPLDRVWVDANYKETKLADVRIGQPAKLVADFYGDAVVFHGRVLGLTPGTGSAFALLPPQNATGNWVKIVQRLPVRIALDPQELLAHPLRIGLSMTVAIDTHDRSGPVLTTLPASAPVAATTIYAQDIMAADARVAQIIADNLGRK